ncbi:MAG: histidinol-phosphate transaminase [Pyrinomonadaceae bacterium]
MFDLARLVRPNIDGLKPYSSARAEFVGAADVFLDANENAFGSPAGHGLNRYPDPLQAELKRRVATLKDVDPAQIFVGNGSDEAIDLLFRIFCRPGRDEVIICPPTYGMYQVSADINDVAVREVRLTDEFQLDVRAILKAITPRTKLIFICSPNNPTGNLMRRESVIEIAAHFGGVVVVDEAYIDFANEPSFVWELKSVPNLVVLQTFSKAWGMAGLRVGLAFASGAIIDLLNRVKPPYNVSSIAQQAVLSAVETGQTKVSRWIEETLRERTHLVRALGALEFVETVFPSDANFLLARVDDADAVYRFLVDCGIVVRNRSNVEMCGGCLRITVGTPNANTRLISALENFS